MRPVTIIAVLVCSFAVSVSVAGKTALMKAVDKGNLTRVHALIEKGVDINECHNRWPYTALAEAVSEGEAMMSVLIEAGADVNPTCGSRTPLAVALGEGEAMMEVLIEAGADVDLEFDGRTLLELAAQSYAPAIVNALLRAGADPDSGHALHSAIRWADEREAMIRLLLDAGADVNARRWGQTPLMIGAGYATSVEEVRLLLEAGADPLAQDDDGRTALEYIDRDFGEYYEPGGVVRDAELRRSLRALIEIEAVQITARRQQGEIYAAAADRGSAADEMIARDSALPPEMRHDKYMIALTEHLKHERYLDSLPYFEALERLGLELDPAFRFYYGEALHQVGLQEDALEQIHGYLKTAGSEGQHYKSALRILTAAEKAQAMTR